MYMSRISHVFQIKTRGKPLLKRTQDAHVISYEQDAIYVRNKIFYSVSRPFLIYQIDQCY